MQEHGARRDKSILEIRIDRDVRTSEAVERLLGIADEEQLAGSVRTLRQSFSLASSAARSSRISACKGSVSCTSSMK